MGGAAGQHHGAGAGQECPVCAGSATALFLRIDEKDYWRCATCAARFLSPGQRPTPDVELATYLLHQNSPDDPGYRAFLGRLADPLLARLPRGASGLDYGCGPGPALALMLRAAGHEVALYDPFFAPDRGVLARRYDFITCTEAAEHFHDPAAEFAQMRAALRPGGWLALMTCFQTDDARFAGWQYRADPTHVVFYREETFRHLAQLWGMTVEVPRKDVVLMRQPEPRA